MNETRAENREPETMNNTTSAPERLSCIRFVRPTLAEWTELQRRADNASNGCIVHCVRSIIGWMRDLYHAPEWSEGHTNLWNYYTAALNAELRPNIKGVPAAAGGTESTNKPCPPLGTTA